MNWLKKALQKSWKKEEKEIFGDVQFQIAGHRTVVAEPTARRYINVLKILGEDLFQHTEPIEASSVEQYLIKHIERTRLEDALIETKLKQMIISESTDLVELYKAVFVITHPITLEDVLNEPFWQIQLGLSIFFWRHRKPFQKRDFAFFKT